MVESILGEGGLDTYMQQLTGSLDQMVDSINQKLLGEDSEGPLAESARGNSSYRREPQASYWSDERNATALGTCTRKYADQYRPIDRNFGTTARKHSGILGNADSLSQQLVDAQLDEAIEGVKGTITQLNETLAGADVAVAGLNQVMGKIENGEGTLGMLVQDETLYRNLNALSYSLDSLTTDMQERPYRYLPLKSRNRVKRYDRKMPRRGIKRLLAFTMN